MSDVKAGGAYVELSLQSEDFRKQLLLAERQLASVARTIGSVGKGMAAFGAAGIAGFIPAIKAASDFQETMSKFDVVFGDQSAAMREFSDGLAKELGRSRSEIASFLATSQDLFVPLGFDAKSATELSKTLTSLAVDLGSFNNVADADALNDLQAALTGSGEVMKKYGVIVSESAVKQQLLNQSIDPTVATEQQKVMARLSIILAGTSAAQGDATRTAGSFANQVKALKAELSNMAVTVGSAVIPALTGIVGSLSEAVKYTEKYLKANADLIIVAGSLSAALATTGVALVGISKTIEALISIIGVSGAIIATFAGVLASIPVATYAIGAAVAATIASLLSFGNTFKNVTETISTTLSAVKTALLNGELIKAAKFTFNGMAIAIFEILKGLGDAIAGFFLQAAEDIVNSPILRILAPFATVFAGISALIQNTTNNLTSQFEDARSAMRDYVNQSRTLAETQEDVAVATQKVGTAAEDTAKAVNDAAEAQRAAAALQQQQQGNEVFDATRTAAEKYRTELGKLSALYAAGAISQETNTRAVRQARQAYLESTGAVEADRKARDEAAGVFEATRTASERYSAEVAKLQTLQKQGLITTETMNRALAQAKTEFDSSNEAIAAGKRVFDETRTASEKYATQIDELKKLQAAGAIDQDTFSRAIANAKKTFDLENAGNASSAVADRLPTQLATTGGARVGQIFGAEDTIQKQQLKNLTVIADESKRTRQAIERGKMVFTP